MNPFYNKVYNLVSKVPKGKVVTYGQIAKKLNSKAYRAVGTAMNKNPYGYSISSEEAVRNRRSVIRGDSKRNSGFFLVPCHRVINSDGKIGGFAERLCENKSAKRNVKIRAGLRASGTKNKIKMLKAEGVEIINGKIDLKKFGWKFR